MKKIISSLLIVFLLTFCFNIVNVYADCESITNPTACENAKDGNGNKCYWNSKNSKCVASANVPEFLKEQDTVSCGYIKNIPEYIPFITELTINIFTIISIGMLVIMGTIDLFQGIVSGKEDVMKKNQKAFFGRLTSAIIIFLLVALTKLFIGFIANVTGGSFGIAECVDCFINNKCS